VRILGVFPTQSRPRSPGSDRLISGPASHRSWVLQGWPGARNSRGGDAGFPQASRLLLALTTCTTCKKLHGGPQVVKRQWVRRKGVSVLRSLSAYLRSNVSVPPVHGAKNVSVPSGKLAVFHSPTALAVPRWVTGLESEVARAPSARLHRQRPVGDVGREGEEDQAAAGTLEPDVGIEDEDLGPEEGVIPNWSANWEKVRGR